MGKYFDGVEVKLKTKESIDSGTLVTIDNQKKLKIVKSEESPMGIAARDLKEGETILYNTQKNTKDVLIQGQV